MTENLRTALEPFVKHYEPWMENLADEDNLPVYSRHTMGDLRRARAALAAAPQPAPVDDWRNDPSGDERWNAGCDYAMTALCKLLCINADDVTWDAATEELEGDVLAVLGSILTVRFGDDWRKAAPQPAQNEGEAHAEDTTVPGNLRPLMGDGSIVVGDRSVLIEQARALLAIDASGNAVPRVPNLAVSIIERLVAALAAAPQPAVAEREALAKLIWDTAIQSGDLMERETAYAIADALLARGLRLPEDKPRP